ncbi:hypothetical protein JCGZ_13304 [Jatropha curcas]|uniref:Uncharacterized protein n=1 Tax=Jatropha curcas TaxID=180498 RepID=A0A067KKN7_JATCU|nr:hypothetical protein JCGZ_13304 [Jatropha curcas]
MATTPHEKQKKGFFNFYKFTNKKYYNPNKSELISIATNKIVSHNLSTKKLKNFQEIAHGAGEREGEGGGGGGGGKLMEGRKSVSHVETNLESVASFLQVKVLVSDMPGFMQVHAFRCARRTFESLEKFSPKHMAYNIKKLVSLAQSNSERWLVKLAS